MDITIQTDFREALLPLGEAGWGSNEAIFPYFVVLYSTEQIACLLVNQSTHQLSLIWILN